MAQATRRSSEDAQSAWMRGGSDITKKPLGQAPLDVLTGTPLFLTAPLYRSWHLRWGASQEEVRSSMPGDELVPQASFNATRAITIQAPPEHVWPWIVQLGYRQAGWYTYDLLDNAGYESADSILSKFQDPKVGDWVPMAKTVNDTTAFKVRAFKTNEWLLWAKTDSAWAWKLTRLDGDRTRLVSRLKQRYMWESPGVALFTMWLFEFGDFPMTRKCLLGIRARAERAVPV